MLEEKTQNDRELKIDPSKVPEEQTEADREPKFGPSRRRFLPIQHPCARPVLQNENTV